MKLRTVFAAAALGVISLALVVTVSIVSTARGEVPSPNTACNGCHQAGGQAPQTADFEVANVDRLSVCKLCHQTESDIATGHHHSESYSYPPRVYVDGYGFFLTPESAFITDTVKLHFEHSGPGYPLGFVAPSYCGAGCHSRTSTADPRRPVKCTVCHTATVTHEYGRHGSDLSSTVAAPVAPESGLWAATPGIESPDPLTCINGSCHNSPFTTPSIVLRPTCNTCHGDKTSAHDYTPALHETTILGSTCTNHHTPGAAPHTADIATNHTAYQQANSSTLPTVCYVCHSTPNYPEPSIASGKNSNCFTCHGASGPAQSFTPNHNPYYETTSHTASNTTCFNAVCHAADLQDTHILDRNNNGVSGCSDCHRADFITAGKSPSDCFSCHTGQTPDNQYESHIVRHASTTDTSTCVQSGCHVSNNLKEEHFVRTPSTGGTFECTTCHASPRTEVQTAIQTGNTACSACHGANAAQHTTLHEPTTLDANCTSCHATLTGKLGPNNNIADAHVGTRNMICDTCHGASARQQVKDAIAAFHNAGTRATCTSCHEATPNATNHAPLHQPTTVDASCTTTCHATLGAKLAVNTNIADAHVGTRNMACDTCHGAGARQQVKDAIAAFHNQGTRATCTSCHEAIPSATNHTPLHEPTTKDVGCTDTCHATLAGKLGAQNNIADAHVGTRNMTCDTCHGATGRQEAKDAITAFHNNGTRATCLSCHASSTGDHRIIHEPAVDNSSCVSCHTDNLQTEHADNRALTCDTCHNPGASPTATQQRAQQAISDYVASGRTVKAICSTCHLAAGQHVNTPCDSCHGPTGVRPIDTNGKHSEHYTISLTGAGYGDTANDSTPTNYAYGCGTCHALDASLHVNGTVNVELSNVAAPSGTIKDLDTKKNAAYAAPNCTNVYCHSNAQLLSGYIAATVNWITGSAMTCTSCHGNPPTTGEHNKHVNSERFQCYTCHDATVDANRNIIDRTKHVNGTKDIVFDPIAASTSIQITYPSGVPTCNGSCHGESHSSEHWTGSATQWTPTPTPVRTATPTNTPTVTPTPTNTATPTPTSLAASTPTATPTPAGPVVITNLSPSAYRVGTFNVGSTYYVDRSYTISSMPAYVQGQTGVKTVRDDGTKGYLSVQFTIDRPATVYVAWPANWSAPYWLTSSFVRTADRIYETDSNVSYYQLYSRDYSAGTVRLEDGNNASRMYFVITKPN